MKQGNIKGYPRFFLLQHRASNPFQAMRVHQISAKLTKPFMVLPSWQIKTSGSGCLEGEQLYVLGRFPSSGQHSRFS